MGKKIMGLCVLCSILCCIVVCIFIINLNNNTEKWYENNRMIAHAGGGYRGLSYTNSLDAIVDNYQNGHRVFEVDFLLTSDKQIVLRHDWGPEFKAAFEQEDSWESDVPTYEEYKNSLIGGRFTVGTLENLCNFMITHKDVYIVTDTKDADLVLVKEMFDILYNYLLDNNYEKLMDRFVVQIYTDEMLETVNDIADFPNKIYTLYYRQALGEEIDWERFADFCVDNNIESVTLPANWVGRETCNTLTQNNLVIYTHTINRLKDMKSFMDMGVWGIYTDWLLPDDF